MALNEAQKAYLKNQKAWIKEVGLKDGDELMVIVEPPHHKTEEFDYGWSTEWVVGMRLTVDASTYKHDARGLSVHSNELQLSSEESDVWALPFFCVTKL